MNVSVTEKGRGMSIHFFLAITILSLCCKKVHRT